jgi:RNA polymerase sigma factor (TIGR02999 family)
MESAEITRLLERWRTGDKAAFDDVISKLYTQLLELARIRLSQDGRREGLATRPPDLVAEAYIKLVGEQNRSFHDRAHFKAVFSQALYRILVDHARRRRAAIRGGGRPVVSNDVAIAISPDRPTTDRDERLLKLDEGLEALSKENEQWAKLFKEKYFGGLSLDEVAEAEGISVSKVKRDLREAKDWIECFLDGNNLEGNRDARSAGSLDGI